LESKPARRGHGPLNRWDACVCGSGPLLSAGRQAGYWFAPRSWKGRSPRQAGMSVRFARLPFAPVSAGRASRRRWS